MEYRRFVAYIYEYVNGRKQKNAGFAKLESRNGLLRMQVSLQKIPREEETLSIYGFVREGGWLPGIFLGQCSVRGGSGTLRLATPAAQVGGSRHSFEELCGLWAEGSSGRKYITVFDDEGVDVTRLMPETPGEKEKKETEPGSGADAGAEGISEAEKPETETGVGERTEAAQEAKSPGMRGEADEKGQIEAALETKDSGTKTAAGAEEQIEAASEAQDPDTKAEADTGDRADAAPVKGPQEMKVEAGMGDEIAATSKMEEPRTTMERGAEKQTEAALETIDPGTMAKTDEGELMAAAQEAENPEAKAEADKGEKADAAPAKEHLRVEGEAVRKGKRDASPEGETLGIKERSEEGQRAEPWVRGMETKQAKGVPGRSETGAKPWQAVPEIREPEARPSDGRVHAQEAACMPYRCPYMRTVPSQLDRKWQFMKTRFPHFQPFSGNEVAACLQITPRELPCIFQGYSRRANNSFLMHGFSQYRHLLFGRLKDGGYILGVPGIFESQEKLMADMFGFPEFREAEGNRCGRRFGYWCRRI